MVPPATHATGDPAHHSPAPEQVEAAWTAFGDPRTIRRIVEVSAFVSTNHVYRVELSDATSVIAKVAWYGSYFLFREDHERLQACKDLLAGTRFADVLAGVLTKGGWVFTHFDATEDVWTVFYEEVARRESLPKVLSLDQIDQFAREMARFHRACADVAPRIPPTSTSIKSDAIHLLDLVSNERTATRFSLSAGELQVVRDHCHKFLFRLDELHYDHWPKLPVLIDWNLGNFSIETRRDGTFRLFSRWDYDWFRIEPRMMDFYFLSRVSSSTGDRTHFTYSPHTLVEPRFQRFVRAYEEVFPLSDDDIAFLAEAYRFFILNYVIREGDRFFRNDLWRRLQKEAVNVYLPAVDRLDLQPLLDAR